MNDMHNECIEPPEPLNEPSSPTIRRLGHVI